MERPPTQRRLVKRILQRQIDRQLGSQFSLFSEIFGKPIKPDLFSKDRVKLRRKAERWLDDSFDTFGTEWNVLSLDEKQKRLGLFLDKAFRLFARVPKGKHALLWYRKQMEDALTVRGSSKVATSYNRYSNAIG